MAIKKNDLIELLVEARVNLPDQKALKFKAMYPVWKAGVTVEVGQRYQYEDKLYKCKTAHTTADHWKPSIDTASLWVIINETHSGTLEDPIPAFSGMEYIKGLHYIENGVIYIMNRAGMNDGEAIQLNYLPSELVGQYFAVV